MDKLDDVIEEMEAFKRLGGVVHHVSDATLDVWLRTLREIREGAVEGWAFDKGGRRFDWIADEHGDPDTDRRAVLFLLPLPDPPNTVTPDQQPRGGELTPDACGVHVPVERQAWPTPTTPAWTSRPRGRSRTLDQPQRLHGSLPGRAVGRSIRLVRSRHVYRDLLRWLSIRARRARTYRMKERRASARREGFDRRTHGGKE